MVGRAAAALRTQSGSGRTGGVAPRVPHQQCRRLPQSAAPAVGAPYPCCMPSGPPLGCRTPRRPAAAQEEGRVGEGAPRKGGGGGSGGSATGAAVQRPARAPIGPAGLLGDRAAAPRVCSASGVAGTAGAAGPKPGAYRRTAANRPPACSIHKSCHPVLIAAPSSPRRCCGAAGSAGAQSSCGARSLPGTAAPPLQWSW